MPKILVVDDHPLFREALGGTLRQAISDSTVIEAHNIEGAVEAILANKDIDLVLLDLVIYEKNIGFYSSKRYFTNAINKKRDPIWSPNSRHMAVRERFELLAEILDILNIFQGLGIFFGKAF